LRSGRTRQHSICIQTEPTQVHIEVQTDPPSPASPSSGSSGPYHSAVSSQSTQTTMSNSPPRDKSKLRRFNGTDLLPTASTWIALFEIVSPNCTPDYDKIIMMMDYLDGEALEWYGTDIAPRLSTVTWNECRQQLIDRFTSTAIQPNIAAQYRKLKRDETVIQYYNSKMALLRKTGLNDTAMAAELTEGLPMHMKTMLIGAQVKTPKDWLAVAAQFEAALVHHPQPQHLAKPRYTSTNHPQGRRQLRTTNIKQHTAGKTKPPHPCRYCKDHGQTEWHWHNECPRRKQSFTSINTFDAKPQVTQVLSDASNIQSIATPIVSLN
jgi:hypothetical protein